MRTFRLLALAAVIPAGLVGCNSEEKHLDVTVDWNDVKQTIDGFGASSAFFGDNISDEIADQLFDAKKGIGLSLLRIMIGMPDDVTSDGSEPEDGKPIATAPELFTAKQALSRGAKVWATAWTPPPMWKTTNNKNGKGDGFDSNTLKEDKYEDFAKYLADFVDMMKTEGVEISGVSPINEPDYTATWDNAQLTPDQLAKFIGEYMGPMFKDRWPDVQIISPDTADWPSVDRYLNAMFAGPAKDYLSVVATHPYQNSNDKIVLDYRRPADNGKRFWETEWSQENMHGDTPDPTMVSAIDMMRKLHDHMTISNLNAWNWWAIYISPDALQSADEDKVRQNPALIQPDEKFDKSYMFKRGYALGHWSRFVRPGFKRIAATDHPLKSVLIEAYRDDAEHLALIAVNTGNNTITQNFMIDGHSFGTLTPWITSPNDAMSAKGTLDGGDSFTYDLPPQSVITFVNWDANKDTPNQGTLPVINKDAGTDAQTTTGGLDCSAAIVPNNGGEGGVTDFSDYKSSKWGDPAGLSGFKYGYQGPSDNDSQITVGISAEDKNMKVTGEVFPGGYGGAGLSFLVCTTVASFTKVQFTVSGSNPGCDMELQIKTYEQTPSTQNPAGSCDQEAGSCYNYPVAKRVAVPTADPTDVVVTLADQIPDWGESLANQVIGLQWQWTANSDLDADAGVGCPIDVTITNIKFVP